MDNYQHVKLFYKSRYHSFGNSVQSLGWSSSKEQLIRFEALTKDFDKQLLKKESIVDFGCGLAHFLTWLQEKGFSNDYTGVDIIEEFLEQNRFRFPKNQFLTSHNFLNNQKKYGFIFASGAFTIPWGDNHVKKIKSAIKELFNKCNFGFSFNMLSVSSIFKNPRYYYFDPLDVSEYCAALTSKHVLDCSYLPGDFTIRMWK
ncbi:methyltransferase domain-containing protein [Desulfoscipio geothermicus]|uniref:Methyltransferase domain-containing protein n=1 Tax=Desulfoscipio geothermicus DSM 3669 TaxID=1121426 RepID=A0A1I6EGD4_9FIRM|nr:class I SAM-dependent methyltransferase [Desulfoscipio geothermicus]SFR16611.1 hypothetical protein SAMN05660706_14113 [Desulfoscipio geothermicus DSM 3669]